MNRQILWLPALLLGAGISLFAQTAPSKVGIIHIQNAIIGTKDGQAAAKALEEKFMPRRKEVEKKQADIAALQNQLRASSNTASEDVKNKLMRDIDAKQKSLQRDAEDFQAEVDAEQQKVLGELGGKIMAVIDKYATDNGFAIIIDVSSQQSPVLYAATSIDITREVVGLYDKNAPGAAPAAAPAPAKKATPGAK
ncbi:MAG: OmpH family outer membrane protein [Acidobacteriota bacterium]|nr:OmpH family outer membrane protein [Bryobacteraceae bacterium CoA2 C42]MCA2963891.1 OmpH family outer membrane protein [Acidobacteriaceae bacterium]